MVSVVILTKNEESDLPACLDSLAWAQDVHVVDSGSTDRTVDIAKQSGAKVLVNPFQSFAHQRNWAIDHCSFENSWILFLDADERSTLAFEKAVLSSVEKAETPVAGFFCCWKMMLGGRWLKRSDNFPKWQFRLLRRGSARFIDVGHGQKEGAVDGVIQHIMEPYLHYPFSNGWESWMERHRRYAKLEADDRLGNPLPRLRQLLSPHASQRNTAIKRTVANIPLWPQFRFFYSYVAKGGWLEGSEGFEYCRKMMWYEMQIQIEMKRLKMQRMAA
ncbi:MAG: glycosyltransferase family 2 protein [Verrucomicrobia bacterium]|nr:glycosyltransferase family 2 protein [Verrucomicrobiota bacterium]